MERNPWDRFISLYYFINNTEPRPSITEFLESKWANFLPHRGYYLYTIKSQIAVDKICLYENLIEDLEEVRKNCNLPEKLSLPRANSSTRKDPRNYREILNKDQADKIGKIFMKEIELFGYEF